MKKLVLLFGTAVVSFQANAQKISVDIVPAAVVDAFKGRFSIAEKTNWEIDYDKYEAHFVVGKTDFTAKFDKDGKWLETDTYMKPSELPRLIREEVSKKYGDLSAYKIEEAEKIEKEKEITYLLLVKKGEDVYDLEFDEKGELLSDEKRSDIKND